MCLHRPTIRQDRRRVIIRHPQAVPLSALPIAEHRINSSPAGDKIATESEWTRSCATALGNDSVRQPDFWRIACAVSCRLRYSRCPPPSALPMHNRQIRRDSLPMRTVQGRATAPRPTTRRIAGHRTSRSRARRCRAGRPGRFDHGHRPDRARNHQGHANARAPGTRLPDPSPHMPLLWIAF